MDYGKIEDLFINMRASGKTVREIARKLRKSTNKICELNKKYYREIEQIKKEKLTTLQKLLLEQKQSRNNFLVEQLQIIKSAILDKEISLNYRELVTLAMKINDTLDKSDRDFMLEQLRDPITNVIGEKTCNPDENKEVSDKINFSDNIITQNENSTSKNIETSVKSTDKSENDGKISPYGVIENDESENRNIFDDEVPRTRADFWLRARKANMRDTPS